MRCRRRPTIALLALLALTPCAPALVLAEEGSGDNNNEASKPPPPPPPPPDYKDTMTGS